MKPGWRREGASEGAGEGGSDGEREEMRCGFLTPLSPATCCTDRRKCWQVVGCLWQVKKQPFPAGREGCVG